MHRWWSTAPPTTRQPLVSKQIGFGLRKNGQVAYRPLYRIRRVSAFGQNCANGRYGKAYWFRAPAVDEDFFYSVRYDSAHIPGHTATPSHQLEIFDRETGAVRGQIRPHVLKALDPCAPPVIFGKHMITIDGGRPIGGYDADEDKGKVVFTELGVPPRIVYEMHTDRIRATLVVGDTLFLRTYQDIIAFVTAAKKANHSNALPRCSTSLTPSAQNQPTHHRWSLRCLIKALPEAPASILRDRQIPQNWLKLGPFPVKTDPLAEMGGPAALLLATGQSLLDQTVTAVDPAHVTNRSMATVKAAGKPNSVTYYFTLLNNERQSVRKVNIKGMGTKVWLAGQEVTQGQSVKLGVGKYPLVMEVRLGRVPPMLKVGTTMSFDTIEDPTEALERWRATGEASREALERIVAEQPTPQLAAHAKRILSALDEQ